MQIAHPEIGKKSSGCSTGLGRQHSSPATADPWLLVVLRPSLISRCISGGTFEGPLLFLPCLRSWRQATGHHPTKKSQPGTWRPCGVQRALSSTQNNQRGWRESCCPALSFWGQAKTPNTGGCHFEAEHQLQFPSFSIFPLASLSRHGGMNLAPRQAPEGEGSQ